MSSYDLQQLLSALAPIVIAIGGGIYTFFATRSKITADELAAIRKTGTEEIAKLDERLDVVERRLEKVDQVITQLPTIKDFHELDRGLTEVKGQVSTISTSLRTAASSLERIENYLIESARAAGAAR